MKPIPHDKLILLAGTGVSAGASMLYVLIAGRMLGPERSADFYAGAFLLLYLIAIGQAVHKTVSIQATGLTLEQGGALLRWTRQHTTKLSAALIGLSLLLVPWLSELLKFQSPWSLGVVFVSGVLYLQLHIERGYVRAQERFVPYGISLMVETVVRPILAVVLLTLFLDTTLALTIHIAGTLLSLVVLRRQNRPHHAAPPKATRHFYTLLVPLMIFSVFDIGLMNLDVLFVKGQFGQVDAGLFGAVATLGRGVGVLIMPFYVVVLPKLVLAAQEGRSDALVLGKFMGLMTLTGALVMGAFFLLDETMVSVLYGAPFVGSAVWLFPYALQTLLHYMAGMFALSLIAQATIQSAGVLRNAFGEPPLADDTHKLHR